MVPDEFERFLRAHDDPRVRPSFVRYVPGPPGATLLIGVVHDHPASVARVRTLLGDYEPTTLALELPPLAIPLFRRYARDEHSPPRSGGEMSAAIQAAPDASVVGIDGPSRSFYPRLVYRLVAERTSPRTTSRLLASVGSATRHALLCRLAAGLMRHTTIRMELREPRTYTCDATDEAERQAAHERAHVSAVRALCSGGPTGRDGTSSVRDRAREAHMIRRLQRHRRDGPVAAVVGIDHLDGLAAGLASE